jgi:hypothetical protein
MTVLVLPNSPLTKFSYGLKYFVSEQGEEF